MSLPHFFINAPSVGQKFGIEETKLAPGENAPLVSWGRKILAALIELFVQLGLQQVSSN